jgi:hypothetical protein
MDLDDGHAISLEESREDDSDQSSGPLLFPASGLRKRQIQRLLGVNILVAALLTIVTSSIMGQYSTDDRPQFLYFILLGLGVILVEIIYFSLLFFFKKVPDSVAVDRELGVVTFVFSPVAGIPLLGRRQVHLPLHEVSFAVQANRGGLLTCGRAPQAGFRLGVRRGDRTTVVDLPPQLRETVESSLLEEFPTFDWTR